MPERRHHLPVVTVQRHDGAVKVCPHCQKEVTPESVYTDAKGWKFHRPCFHKGRGSIDFEKKSLEMPLRTIGGTALGAGIGHLAGRPLIGAAVGGALGGLSEYVVPSVDNAAKDPLANLAEERRKALQDKFKTITDTLAREGAYTNTYHKRIVVPHDYLNQQDLSDLGFMRSRVAVPERGQTEFTTWRHPNNLYHFHTHPTALTVHEDFYPSMDMLRYGKKSPLKRLTQDLPRGLSHVLTEGVPGYMQYIGNHIKGLFSREKDKEHIEVSPGKRPKGMVRAILKENPNAIIKFSSTAPVPHERQIDDAACGPAVLKSVEETMGGGRGTQQQYEQETGTTEAKGTPIVSLEQTAANHGMNVDARQKMDLNQLQQMVGNGMPVITAVQLDGPEGGPSGGWEAGHYVVVTGIGNGQITFMDPNSDAPERSWPIQEFLNRWHDHDHQGNAYEQWGMAISPKQAAEGALGSGADQSQNSQQSQVMDGSGMTPAGASDMQPANPGVDEKLLDLYDQPPDPTLFDTMAMGTDENQQALDNTGVAWPGIHRQDSQHTGWKNRLAAMVNDSYQDSGTSAAGGRVFASSSPANQSGASIQQQPGMSAPENNEPHMQLDSDTNSTGQPKHLNA